MSNPSDHETPRERAERVLRGHRHCGDCSACLLARDVIALSEEIDRQEDETDALASGHCQIENVWRERAEKAEAALAEAAKEIDCAGPVAHRIRILKAEMGEALRKAEAENQRLREAMIETAGK